MCFNLFRGVEMSKLYLAGNFIDTLAMLSLIPLAACIGLASELVLFPLIVLALAGLFLAVGLPSSSCLGASSALAYPSTIARNAFRSWANPTGAG